MYAYVCYLLTRSLILSVPLTKSSDLVLHTHTTRTPIQPEISTFQPKHEKLDVLHK